MMKKLWISIALLMTVVVAGCTKTQESVISFDTFTTTVKSPYVYTQTKVTANNNVQKVYTTTQSGFRSSIIIANEAVLSGDSISFANENLTTLRTNLENRGKITDTQTITLNCGDKEIPASISTIEVTQWETTRYVSQMYFVNNLKGYIISHLSEDKSDAKSVQKGLRKLTCEKA